MNDVTRQLIEKARRLLSDGTVKVVIGYEVRANGETTPVFIRCAEDCERLVFNDRCYANLTGYLTKPEVRALGRPAIVSKGCDNRAINVLINEARVRREDIYILGVECPGMDKPVCAWCERPAPTDFDDLIPADKPKAPAGVSAVEPSSAGAAAAGESGESGELAALDSMSPEERWDYWMSEFSRCIRCFACRQICPICHCKRCMAEKNQPQWIDSSPHPRGNLKWNLIRAFHQTGRCVECGECERACPMGIPLSRLSRGIRELTREKFAFTPGIDPKTAPPLASFREDDQEDFFQ